MKTSIKEHLLVFGSFLVLFALRFLLYRFVWFLMNRQTAISFFAALLIMISFSVFLFVMYVRWSGIDTFRLKGIDVKIWVWTFVICIADYFFVWTFYGQPIWITEKNIYYGAVTDFGVTRHIIQSIGNIFCYSVISAILFRGILQKQLSKFLAPWLSISIVTLVLVMYAYLNFTPNVLPAFLSGIFVGIIYHKTGKLILCIFFHAFNN